DGDFDGDARADLTVFRPSTNTWFRLNSSDGGFVVQAFGAAGDRPVAADYDKDGKTDFAVFRPSTGQFFTLRSKTGQFTVANWGANGDIPLAGAAN
ncbi:MAG TPA: VCBS repeat-containing protein, partial [Pyrinomonadaceae bacterium]|nr:VCBS repeat-containing protein [Pyrinomonadaceae bacterium]